MRSDPASFRDPCGRVYIDGANVWRTVTRAYENDWEKLKETGLLSDLTNKGLLPFQETNERIPETEAIAVLKSPRLPFISYSWEWSFSQLKDAALLTLDMHSAALEHGFALKDASAFNVQFHDGKPVFIDHLSFEIWDGKPWQAYGQFCQHFLAPLSLMAKKDTRLGRLSQVFIDGIPLDLASSLLPATTKLSPGLAMHVHMHANMRKKYSDARVSAEKVRAVKMDAQKMLDVADSLRSAVNGLSLSKIDTEWGEYYSDTNYSPAAKLHKEKLVSEIAERHKGAIAVDLGANTGEFSRLMAPHFDLVLAPDGDHTAVDKHWKEERVPNVLPLLGDLSTPSPSIGWGNAERPSFTERCEADFVSALAIVHHLRFTFGIPFSKMAEWFQNLLNPGGTLLVEYVHKTDSQVQRLLAARDDVFNDYGEEDFVKAHKAAGFVLKERISIKESDRIFFVFKRNY